jgi:hypothetical protein
MVKTDNWRQALTGAGQPTFYFKQIEQFLRLVCKNASDKLKMDKLKVTK